MLNATEILNIERSVSKNIMTHTIQDNWTCDEIYSIELELLWMCHFGLLDRCTFESRPEQFS